MMKVTSNMSAISTLNTLNKSSEGGESTVNNDDMKKVKFEILCSKIYEYLNTCKEDGIRIYLFWNDEYDNKYMECVKNVCTYDCVAPVIGWGNNRCKDGFASYMAMYTLDNLHKEIDGMLDDKVSADSLDRVIGERHQRIYQVVFWNLLAVMIDPDVYEKDLSKVIDVAYSFDFTEAMMKDWCNAVKYVLEGNFKKDFLGADIKSPAGRTFFLHGGDYCD